MNLALAKTKPEETRQELQAAQLSHELHNLDQTKVLMDVKDDRETLSLFPELATLMQDGVEAQSIVYCIVIL